MGSVLAPPGLQLAKAVLSASWLKLTVPVGAVAEPGVASVTVAVQLVALPTGTEAGVQLTAVVVARMISVAAGRAGLGGCVRWAPYQAGKRWVPAPVGAERAAQRG